VNQVSGRIQAWIWPGFGPGAETFVFADLAGVRDPDMRPFIESFSPTASSDPQAAGTQIGCALGGRTLARLGIDTAFGLAVSTPPVVAMHKRLGITGDPDPAQWKVGGPDMPADMVVVVHGQPGHEADAVATATEITDRLNRSGGRTITHTASSLPGTIEHFGFRDGLSQPNAVLDGDGQPITDLGPDSQPFVHGGEIFFGLAGLDRPDSAPVYPGALEAPVAAGSTMTVVRLLRQDVALFRSWCDHESARVGVNSEWLAAAVVGRWPSGDLFTGQGTDPGSPPDNTFDFTTAETRRCPVGAHIRKVNPRRGGTDDNPARRRILRSGIPWGRPLPLHGPDPDHGDRGLVFVCSQTSIRDQFEFLTNRWVRASGVPNPGAGPDILIGPDPDRKSNVRLPDGRDVPIVAPEPFVTCEGGGYFWTPAVDSGRLHLPPAS